ncbi:MAG: hypothetical protein LBP78_07975 [Acidaminococcales bacterium]|jgi:hypothetical protein|nr:hypothetical protein [Acidaminococcales bacterium]
MKIEKYFLSGLLILFVGLLLLYGGYNRPGFRTASDVTGSHSTGAPAAMPLPHTGGAHK